MKRSENLRVGPRKIYSRSKIMPAGAKATKGLAAIGSFGVICAKAIDVGVLPTGAKLQGSEATAAFSRGAVAIHGRPTSMLSRLIRDYNWSRIEQPSVRMVPIEYQDRDKVDALLGDIGRRVLHEVLVVIRGIAAKRKWPLRRIEVEYSTDPELRDWNVVLVLMEFDGEFCDADAHLQELYDELDRLSDSLTPEQRNILQSVMYFDVQI